MSTENYDPCFPDQPVVDQYLPVWAKQPAFGPKPAFIWAHDTSNGPMSYTVVTYSELDASVQRMAVGLLRTLRREDTVLVLASQGLRLVKLLFACQRAGLTAVPIIPPDLSRFSPEARSPAHLHLLRAISQTRPRAVIADARYIGTVMKSVDAHGSSNRLSAALTSLRWLSVDQLEQDDASVPALTGYEVCRPDDVYLIQYTSGATGVPKPVVVTAGSAAHNVRAARRAYDLHPGSVIVSWLPKYHDCGLMFVLLTVVAGATCVLTSPNAFLRRPRLWLELIDEFKATCTPVPSFALPLVLKRGRRTESERRPQLQLGSLRNLILINEPIYKSCVDQFVEEFRPDGLDASSISPSYGLAENCTFVSTAWQRAHGNSQGRHLDFPSYKKLLPSARLSPVPVFGEEPEIEIAVVDEETGEPVADGVEGEIWVSSPSNASGYLDHQSASSEVFCVRPLGRAGPCFVRTGDRGVVHGLERYLYVVGRSTDVIALDGGQRRVHAHYIETASFDSAPDRLRAGCIAAFAASALMSPSPVVVVAELQKGRDGVHRDICDGIKQAAWKEEGVRVAWVVLVETGVVPKTTSGKLRRGAAREKLLAGKLPKVFEARYDGAEGSALVKDEEKEMEKCVTSWRVGQEEEPGMGMAFGSASRRLRLRSLL